MDDPTSGASQLENSADRLRIFVSAGIEDQGSLGRHVRDSLLQAMPANAAVTRSDELAPAAAVMAEGVAEAIRASDVFVALDDGSTSVWLETGIAMGAGVPVVVVADGPSDLAAHAAARLVTWRSGTAELAVDLAEAVQSVHRRFSVALDSSSSATGADSDRQRVGSRFEEEVADLFLSRGALVRTGHGPMDVKALSAVRPDLVVWHDDLEDRFGLPLPVEALARLTSLEAVLPRLRRTLLDAGCRSLLAIRSDERDAAPDYLAQEAGRFILVIGFNTLADSVRSMGLAPALNSLLDRAMESEGGPPYEGYFTHLPDAEDERP